MDGAGRHNGSQTGHVIIGAEGDSKNREARAVDLIHQAMDAVAKGLQDPNLSPADRVSLSRETRALHTECKARTEAMVVQLRMAARDARHLAEEHSRKATDRES